MLAHLIYIVVLSAVSAFAGFKYGSKAVAKVETAVAQEAKKL